MANVTIKRIADAVKNNEVKALIYANIREQLLALIPSLGLTDAENAAYSAWVANMRRGYDVVAARTEKGGCVILLDNEGNKVTLSGKDSKGNRISHLAVAIAPADTIKGIFTKFYNNKVAKGLDPTAIMKPGRKAKVKVTAENPATGKVVVVETTPTEVEEVSEVAASAIETAVEKAAE